MKATELRIDNLVDTGSIVYNEIQVSKVTHIYDVGIAFEGVQYKGIDDESAYEYFSPIPLTEEWLIKFGFEKMEPGHNIGDSEIFSNYEYKLVALECDWSKTSIVVRKSGMWYCDIMVEDVRNIPHELRSFSGTLSTLNKARYVHQLQNLYFALTGKELELKEQIK